MDIKDFILIGGGLLIAAVVAHGFWIALRDRRQDLRIDIKPDLIPEEVNEIERLRGELPNGGARVVKGPDPEQVALDLEPPLLLEPTETPPAESGRRMPGSEERLEHRLEPSFPEPEHADPEEVDAVLFGADWRETAAARVRDGAELTAAERDPESGRRMEPVLGGAVPERAHGAGASEPQTARRTADRARVAEVALPEPIVADEPKRPRRLGQRKSSERAVSGRRSATAGRSAAEASPESAASVPVEELIVLNLLAGPDRPFTGDELFTTLRTCGLKFGDMNIFHRVEPLTKAVQYSVASAVEPGTFDMADMEAIRCPGLCMFMQLPGPEEPSVAFEDMLSVAKSVVKSLGGDIRDEHRNVMTPQTEEHYRQRIVDFSRRRMSKRA